MSERSLHVAPFPQQTVASEEPPTSGRVDVLALIAEVEKRLGDVRAQVHGQHEDGTALTRERDRLRGEIEILENERSRLLARQLSLESQLAEARATEADAQALVERVKAEAERVKIDAQRDLERLAAEARDARTALSGELMLEFERRAGEAARRLADAERTAQSMALEHANRVQELHAELARLATSLTDAEHAKASLEAERDALLAERAVLADRCSDLSQACTILEGDCDALRVDFDALRVDRDALRVDRDSAISERDLIAAELAARNNELAAVSAELRAQSEELARQTDDFDGISEGQHAMEARLDAARAECTQLQAEVEGLLRERDLLSKRLGEAETAVRVAEDAAHAAAAQASAVAQSAEVAPAPSSGTTSVDEEEIARAAEARIHQMMAPKIAQLAQAAAFLRKRKERLAAVRAGLRRKAQALRVLRQIYAQPRLDEGLVPVPSALPARALSDAPSDAPSETVDAVFGTTVARDASVADNRIADERAELARERQELVDLRAILAASERSIEQRAQGTRLITAAALAIAMLGVAGIASWHLAGAVGPDRVRATVELDVSSRTPEAKQEGAVDAKPIGDEITRALSDEAFLGAVASRISERGRTHDEASALVAGLAGRTQVSTEGAVVRVALTGEGADATVSALDAVATSAVAELNRRSERRSDMLRVGIANARQEVGRTVFSHPEELADPTRIWRAGAILGIFAALAAAAAWTMTWLARRAAHADVH
ncbi:MAG: hypothetical protein LW806_09255 [Planctomycetaceae bacterium]|nr:hypothetical protein [Planctomycetaceae bacterium]